MKRVITILASAGVLWAGVFVGAAAATDSKDCRTVKAHIVDRPDSGQAGNTWALDTFTRTVKICQIAERNGVGKYQADGSDSGSFVTKAGRSPGDTADIPAGIHGRMSGTWHFNFKSAAAFTSLDTSQKDSNQLSTSQWLPALFGGDFQGTISGWSWTYNTRCEQWVNSKAGNHGDITGKKCEPRPRPHKASATIGDLDCKAGGVLVSLDNSKRERGTKFVVTSKVGKRVVTDVYRVLGGETKDVVAPVAEDKETKVKVFAGHKLLDRAKVTADCDKPGDDKGKDDDKPGDDKGKDDKNADDKGKDDRADRGDDRDKAEVTPVSDDHDKGGSLPFTGSPLRLIAGIALALVAAGGLTLGGLQLVRARS